MTVTATALVQAAYAANSETTIYTATSKRTILDKVTGFSATGGTLTFKIVPSAGTAGAANTIVTKTLAAGETYTFPEMVGQILSPGDFISELALAASTVVRRFSGREIT